MTATAAAEAPQPSTAPGTCTPRIRTKPANRSYQKAVIQEQEKEYIQSRKTGKKRKVGRPTGYSEKIAATICERIENGETLTRICSSDSMPELHQVFKWLDQYPEFNNQYRKSRSYSATAIVDRNSDEIDAATDPQLAALLKVKSESRRWIAARHAPELYGDVKRLEVSGEVRHAHALELTQEQRMRIAQEWLTGLESAKAPALIEGTAETTGPDKPKRIKKP